MRRIQTEQIRGNEILAKDIYSGNGVIILPEGTKLKLEYRKRLCELNITDIFVEDEISKEITEEDFQDEVICELCSDSLQNAIETFFYASKRERKKLFVVAEGVIQNVLERKEVLYNVSMVRRKDKSISDHCLSVAALSILVALNAGFTVEQTQEIAIGALLHDIGFMKVKVDYNTVIEDETDDEVKKEIRRHVVYGYMSVEKQEWLSSVAKDIILYHHERIDGSGYPFKLVGDRIKPEVRLVSICDAFDNMIYGNLEHKVKVYEAIEYITGLAGRKFDAHFTNVFVSSVAPYPVGSIVKTNNDQTCIVIRQNNQSPTRPVLRELIRNEDGDWESYKEHDLTEELTVFIVDTVE